MAPSPGSRCATLVSSRRRCTGAPGTWFASRGRRRMPRCSNRETPPRKAVRLAAPAPATPDRRAPAACRCMARDLLRRPARHHGHLCVPATARTWRCVRWLDNGACDTAVRAVVPRRPRTQRGPVVDRDRAGTVALIPDCHGDRASLALARAAPVPGGAAVLDVVSGAHLCHDLPDSRYGPHQSTVAVRGRRSRTAAHAVHAGRRAIWPGDGVRAVHGPADLRVARKA